MHSTKTLSTSFSSISVTKKHTDSGALPHHSSICTLLWDLPWHHSSVVSPNFLIWEILMWLLTVEVQADHDCILFLFVVLLPNMSWMLNLQLIYLVDGCGSSEHECYIESVKMTCCKKCFECLNRVEEHYIWISPVTIYSKRPETKLFFLIFQNYVNSGISNSGNSRDALSTK